MQSIQKKNSDLLELDPFGGGSFFGKVGTSEKLLNGGTAGDRAAYNFSRHVSIEASYNFMSNNVRAAVPGEFFLLQRSLGAQIHSLAIDPVYNFTSRGLRVRPHLTTGARPIWFVPAKPHPGLPFYARGVFYRNPTFGVPATPQIHLNDFETTLGLVFFFGQEVVRVCPKTLVNRDYLPPAVQSVTAWPNEITIKSRAAANQTVTLESEVAASACAGSLSYHWTVSEGALANNATPNPIFDPSSLNFEVRIRQTQTVTATLKVSDETGRSASRSTTITVNCPAQFKRLPNVMVLRGQKARLSAANRYRSLTALCSVRSGLARQRFTNIAASASISVAETEQLSILDPAFCGALNTVRKHALTRLACSAA